jgi:hypothetical protein
MYLSRTKGVIALAAGSKLRPTPCGDALLDYIHEWWNPVRADKKGVSAADGRRRELAV